jgi:hypothetical protein
LYGTIVLMHLLRIWCLLCGGKVLESKFLNVGFVPCQIFGTPNSKIETKCIFLYSWHNHKLNMILCQCGKNFTIWKIWPNDACSNCALENKGTNHFLIVKYCIFRGAWKGASKARLFWPKNLYINSLDFGEDWSNLVVD